VPGGCPILNAAVDADDTHPALRARVRDAMDLLRAGTFERIIARGIERGELRADVDASALATTFVAALEGGLMMSQLYGEPRYLDDAVAHLADVVRSLEPRENQ